MTPEILRIVLVALGIGMVIFVHEGGHFIAARMCGVRVEVFSLGFGPKVLGFNKGGTLYQLALIPFGGYVRMAGEFAPEDGGPPPSNSLRAKSVPQRFFIYAGGVIMNVVFALVCFPLVYHFGVPAVRPVVGSTQPGMPAWHANIPEGTEILKVQGREVNDFMGIPSEVAIAGSSPVTFELRYPGETSPREVVLRSGQGRAQRLLPGGHRPRRRSRLDRAGGRRQRRLRSRPAHRRCGPEGDWRPAPSKPIPSHRPFSGGGDRGHPRNPARK